MSFKYILRKGDREGRCDQNWMAGAQLDKLRVP